MHTYLFLCLELFVFSYTLRFSAELRTTSRTKPKYSTEFSSVTPTVCLCKFRVARAGTGMRNSLFMSLLYCTVPCNTMQAGGTQQDIMSGLHSDVAFHGDFSASKATTILLFTVLCAVPCRPPPVALGFSSKGAAFAPIHNEALRS